MAFRKRVERPFQGIVIQIMHDVIGEDKRLPFEHYIIQEKDRVDIILTYKKTKKEICLIELKDPIAPDGSTPYHHKLIKQAYDYASSLGCPYMVTWNMQDAVFWDRTDVSKRLYYCDIQSFKIFEPVELDFFIYSKFQSRTHLEAVKKFIISLLYFLLERIEKKPFELKPLDERYVDRLNSLINGFLLPASLEIIEKYKSDKNLRKKILEWVNLQFWTWEGTEKTIFPEMVRLTRISLLYLLNKIIFYLCMVSSGMWAILPKFVLPKKIKTSSEAKEYIRKEYFDLICKKIDYETIFGEQEEILDELSFVYSNIIEFVNLLVEQSQTYDFSDIEHDVIGKIFERLIREDERHKMGQYFTRSDIVDLISTFCIESGDETLLDPSCGSGTFLVKAYFKKKELTGKTHPELLEDIWGIDIANYPAHLSSLNLAIRDLRYQKNYPQIILKNFFEVVSERTKHKVRNPDGTEEKRTIPKLDVVITNPPYTRQEEMEHMFKDMKKNAWNRVNKDWSYEISKRSSIYSYFFFHSARFLKEGGKLGYITNNSWLYSDYGKDLQWLFLYHFKIKAIIDSKVEMWFPEPMVNTAITICEKCEDSSRRNKNLVRFIYFKKKLPEINQKYDMAELIKIFMDIDEFEENEYWRVNPIKQKKLLDEALQETGKIENVNWGKYLEAPAVYYEILEKQKNKLCTLNDFSKAVFGVKTGDNKFFIVDDVTSILDDKYLKQYCGYTKKELKKINLRVIKSGYGTLHLIEDEYIKPCMKSTVGFNNILLSKELLKKSILIIHDDRADLSGKKTLDYIKFGVSKGIHEKRTCAARKHWYDLQPEIMSPIAIPERLRDRYLVFENKNNTILNKTLYGCGDNLSSKDIKVLLAILNSTILAFFSEIQGRKPGGGGGPLDLDVKMVNSLVIPKFSHIADSVKNGLIGKYTIISKRDIGTIFEEVGRKDRRDLDDLVLKCYGFKNKKEREKEVSKVYEEYVDMVNARILKAASVRKSSTRKKVDLNLLGGQIIEEVKEELKSIKNNLETRNNIMKFIKERTANRKHQTELISIIWKQLFGADAKIPGEQFDLGLEI